MSVISAKNITIEFPIFGVNSRSLKTSIVKSVTGGKILKENSLVSIKAIDDVSFSFAPGDRIGLLGHNGSGKTTLLRAIAGVYLPSKGSLKVEGKVSSLLDIFLGMDMDATGYENIITRGLIMGKTINEMKMLVDEIVDFSGIGNFLYMPMRTYSSGMAVRLAFATSTCFDADIILMDEWLSVGDKNFKEKSVSRLTKFLNRAKVVIIASHEHKLIKKFANRIICLKHGRIENID